MHLDWIFIIPIAISIVALVRPELSFFLRGLLNDLVFDHWANVEVGYSEYGPTIGINGSILALRNDQIVSDISVHVRRCRDGATYKFNWILFRPNKLVGDIETILAQSELASAFSLRQGEAHRVNVLFNDLETQDPLKQALENYRETFNEFRLQQDLTVSHEEMTDLFSKTHPSMSLEFHDVAMGNFYWTPGDFMLRVAVRTVDPEKKYDFYRRFQIAQKETDALLKNYVPMMMEAEGVATIHNFAHPRLELSSKTEWESATK